MFKLFKDLTRAPETLDAPPLTGQPEGPPQPSYAVRSSRAGSFSAAAAAARQPSAPGDSGLQSVAGMSGIVLSRVPSAEPEEEDIEETDSDAILVVALIHALKDASSTLSYIEVGGWSCAVANRPRFSLGCRLYSRASSHVARFVDARDFPS